MFRILDRYIVREVLPPALISLLIFTFMLELRPLGAVAEPLMAHGASWSVIVKIMMALVPQALGVTVPMSLLVGLLVAFGRISADHEYVAVQASGLSLFRLLRPVLVLGVVFWMASAFVVIIAAPRAMHAFRELTFQMLTNYAEAEMKPRVFITRVPRRVLYIRDITAAGWENVFVADASDPRRPSIYLARRGHLAINRAEKRVTLVLETGTRHLALADRPEAYELTSFRELRVDLDWTSMFPPALTAKSGAEMSLAELGAMAARLEARGESAAEPLMAIQQKFSIPVACLVFAVLGLALGASSINGGKLASFVFGLAIIFLYYVIMFLGRALVVTNRVPPWCAMWAPDVLLGALAIGLLMARARGWDPLGRRIGRFVGRGQALPTVGWSLKRTWTDWGFRTLDRYVAGAYLKVFGIASLALVSVFYISMFTELAGDLFRSAETARLLLPYCIYATPQIVYYVIPLATLIATLVTIGVFTKNSEIVVMKACGVSLYRAAAPLLVAAVVSTATVYALQEQLLAEANRRADGIRRIIRNEPAESAEPLNRLWVMSRTGAIYNYGSVDAARRLLRNLTVFEFDPAEWKIRRRTFAREASNASAMDRSRYDWVAQGGQIWDFPRRDAARLLLAFERISVPLEPLEYFNLDAPDAERMTYRELDRYITDLRTSGISVTPYVVALRRKLSFPFVTIIMTLIAVPFGVTTGRRGAWYGIGVGIGLAFGYWTMLSVFGALGKGGAIAPLLAAWAPNVLFGAGAVYLILTVRT